MFSLTEDKKIVIIAISAFRGSAKSSIMTTSYPLWAILGQPQNKYILILSQTQYKSRQFLMDIKNEMETNELLKKDLGPFQEEKTQWGIHSLIIKKFGAKISTGSLEQSIRGARFGPHRPDLIIIDDIEDLELNRTKEGRDKVFNWFTGEIIPAGSGKTRIVIVGTTLHEDSFLNRVKKKILEGRINGVYREYPIIDDNGNPLWPGKFLTPKEIEEERNRVMDDKAWHREYLLKIISDTERVIWSEWIHYYKELPKDNSNFLGNRVSIDLAISEKEYSSNTAMLSAKIYDFKGKLYIYILPNPINKKLTSPEIKDHAKILSKSIGNGRLIIEDVGYQKSLIQDLKAEGYPATGFQLKGSDKRMRLALTASMIKSGQILFPEKGTEELINQLVGFGSEKYDDLADAFSMLVIRSIEDHAKRPQLHIIG